MLFAPGNLVCSVLSRPKAVLAVARLLTLIAIAAFIRVVVV